MLRQILTSRLHPATVNIVRNLRVRRGDPGMRLRMQVFADDFVQNDPETAENLEPNFMNLREASKQFQKEESRHQAKVPRYIVGQKYFKLKQPNFLTWAEKEQIKILHHQKPDEWTFERLSSSFPADPETISQIIRNQWQPKSEKRILKHDQNVKENWQKLRNGEIQLEPILAEHIKSFLSRKLNQITPPKVNLDVTRKFPKPDTSEFSSIITTCKKYREDERISHEEESRHPQLNAGNLKFSAPPVDPEDNNTTILADSRTPQSGKGIKFDDLMKKHPHLSQNHDENPQIFEYVKENEAASKQSEPDYRTIQRYETSQKKSVELREPSEAPLRNLEIQMKIKIPKTVYEKDKTYQVGDCFYDSKGFFLYRVPGLMN